MKLRIFMGPSNLVLNNSSPTTHLQQFFPDQSQGKCKFIYPWKYPNARKLDGFYRQELDEPLVLKVKWNSELLCYIFPIFTVNEPIKYSYSPEGCWKISKFCILWTITQKSAVTIFLALQPSDQLYTRYHKRVKKAWDIPLVCREMIPNLRAILTAGVKKDNLGNKYMNFP